VRGNSINCANDTRNENDPLCAKELPPQTGAVLARVRAGLEKVEAAELERLYDRLPELDQHSRGEIRKFADRIVAGFLFPPQNSLRVEASYGSDGALLQALQRLFQLSD
jgi:glutamyl-tRNA reductase